MQTSIKKIGLLAVSGLAMLGLTLATVALAAAPGSPSNVKATAISAAKISLVWTKPSNTGSAAITNYRIDKKDGTGTELFATLVTPVSTNTYYNDTAVTAGHTYTYKVYAINGAGAAGTSEPATSNSVGTWSLPSAVVTANIKGVSSTSTQIKLSWVKPLSDGKTPITGYKIERKRTADSAWPAAPIATTSATSYTDNYLLKSTSYDYKISATNSVGTGTAGTVTVSTWTIPGAPTLLTTTAPTGTGTTIKLSWTAPVLANTGGTPITGYKIERAIAGTYSVLVDNTKNTKTTFDDSKTIRNVAYSYRVSAINLIGAGTTPSNIATATVPVVKPLSPTGLRAIPTSTTGILLTWNAVPKSGANGAPVTLYNVARRKDGETTYTDLQAKLTATSTNAAFSASYLDNNEPGKPLVPGTKYFYRVTATNSAGASALPSETAAITYSVPSAVTGLKATSTSTTDVKLIWKAPKTNGSQLFGYKIERKKSGGSYEVLTGALDSMTYTATELDRHETYSFRITPVSSLGEGADSEVTFATRP